MIVSRHCRLLVAILSLSAFLMLAGCSKDSPTPVLRLATTTSTRDSGLLDRLLPAFESKHDCRVDVVAVGTGAALQLGEQGDADVLIVHAREAEQAFMRAGHGTRHEEFMVNHFAVLGPADDPAGIEDRSVEEALQRIVASDEPFFSRGDNSGTHQREELLWERVEGRPIFQQYLQTGRGMGPTLIMANEKQGYVLTDMGTYLKFKYKIDLIPLVEGGEKLRNPYAVITVNPAKSEMINGSLAAALLDYLISTDAQQTIDDYRLSGQQLFRATRLQESE